KALGVPGGYAIGSIELNKFRIEQGFQWITIGVDLAMLTQKAKETLTAFGR
ncbi:MAG: 2,4-dihydroxyhept-2-ene-1,7-dioic acid aldolase, partial [candidate division Zixibacteria bacterium]|nr:2,4-dihydroxyhept-2-ene-1,7-dioic acid aldolase [candidate division Zixibacteria bacterium]